MLYYICSPKYHPMISKIITETDQVCVGSEVGEDVYMKKLIKENIMSFEQVDIMIIDLTATADTDQEIMDAVESMRIMDYKTRFIILAPYKKAGDVFLKECFYAGIYDIIISDEYLEMAQQLALCITAGMRYKDALIYRDTVMEDEEKQETKAIQKILIGVCATAPRMGATHNSIVLANYLRSQNQMVAVLQMDEKNTFDIIREDMDAKMYADGYFSLTGVDFYPGCNRNRLTAISGRLYNFLILDFGAYDSMDKVLYNKCDIRLIFSGTKAWEIPYMNQIFAEQEDDVLKCYHYCFLGTTSPKLQKDIIDSMHPLNNIWFPEYSEDPFSSVRFPEASEILKDYLVFQVPEKNKKKFSVFKGRK